MFVWSNSLADDKGMQNWAKKTKDLPTEINDPAGGLSADKAWFALALVYRKKWREEVHCIPNNSETGGRMQQMDVG